MFLANCGTCHGDQRTGAPPQIPSLVNISSKLNPQQIEALIRQGAGRMPSFPNLSRPEVDAIILYLLTGESKELQASEPAAAKPRFRFTGYHRFLDPDGYPAVVPPWGTLNAINLNTGEYAWRIPLGEYPELAEKGIRNTGTENYGGPIVTAGGLVFIGATNFDKKFHAFDKSTGKLLWETTLPLAGNATPSTYMVGGRQYVVIYASGGYGRLGLSAPASSVATEQKSGVYVAFALPVAMTRRATPRRMKSWRLAASVGDRIFESVPMIFFQPPFPAANTGSDRACTAPRPPRPDTRLVSDSALSV